MGNNKKSKGETKKYDAIESDNKPMRNGYVRLSKESMNRQINNFRNDN